MYDHVVQEGVHGQEGRIDKIIKVTRDYIDAHFKDWLISAKDLIKNFLLNTVLPMVWGLIFNRGGVKSGAAPVPVKKAEEAKGEQELNDAASNIADDQSSVQ